MPWAGWKKTLKKGEADGTADALQILEAICSSK
jgi:hypothetical protein